MRTKSAKQLVMTPLYRQRVVKAKKGKSSYSRKQKPWKDSRGFCFYRLIIAADREQIQAQHTLRCVARLSGACNERSAYPGMQAYTRRSGKVA